MSALLFSRGTFVPLPSVRLEAARVSVFQDEEPSGLFVSSSTDELLITVIARPVPSVALRQRSKVVPSMSRVAVPVCISPTFHNSSLRPARVDRKVSLLSDGGGIMGRLVSGGETRLTQHSNISCGRRPRLGALVPKGERKPRHRATTARRPTEPRYRK